MRTSPQRRDPSSRARRAWFALTVAPALFGVDSVARADGDDAIRWIPSGSCTRAGHAINEGIARKEAKAYMLAGFLYAATGCVAPDPTRAARDYQRAIDLGDVEARAFLGVMHGLGAGIPQDVRAAYRSFSYGRSGPLSADVAPVGSPDRDLIHEVPWTFQFK